MPEKESKINALGRKIMRFFLDLKSELKKVIWPDRKKLIQSTVTVLTICLIMAALVFVIDKILSGTLNAVGFFPATSSTATSYAVSTPISVAPASSSASDSGTSSSQSQAASSAAASASSASSSQG